MRRRKRRNTVAAVLLAAALMIGLMPTEPVKAAAPSLSSRQLTVRVKQTKTLRIRHAKGKTAWKVTYGGGCVRLTSKKKTSVKVVGVKAGIAQVQAKNAGRKLLCRIKVQKKGSVTTEVTQPLKTPATVYSSALPKPTYTVRPTVTPMWTTAPVPTGTVRPSASETPKASVTPTISPSGTVSPSGSPVNTAKPDATSATTINPTASVKPSATVKPTAATSSTPAPTKTAAAAFQTVSAEAGEHTVYIGESVTALTAEWGSPVRTDAMPQGFQAYIYHADSTTDPYTMVGVKDDKVVMYFVLGKGFSLWNATAQSDDGNVSSDTQVIEQGQTGADLVEAGWKESSWYSALDSAQGEKKVGTEGYCYTTSDANLFAFSDYFGDKDIYAAMAYSTDIPQYRMLYYNYMTFTSDTMRAAEQQTREITSAFRIYKGLSGLSWDDKAGNSARKHSEDMATRNYFSHYTQDTNKSPFDRMKAEGVSYHTAGENICCGTSDAIQMTIGWIGSSGHRDNIVNARFTHLGVGVGVNTSADYVIYSTQDFWGD